MVNSKSLLLLASVSLVGNSILFGKVQRTQDASMDSVDHIADNVTLDESSDLGQDQTTEASSVLIAESASNPMVCTVFKDSIREHPNLYFMAQSLVKSLVKGGVHSLLDPDGSGASGFSKHNVQGMVSDVASESAGFGCDEAVHQLTKMNILPVVENNDSLLTSEIKDAFVDFLDIVCEKKMTGGSDKSIQAGIAYKGLGRLLSYGLNNNWNCFANLKDQEKAALKLFAKFLKCKMSAEKFIGKEVVNACVSARTKKLLFSEDDSCLVPEHRSEAFEKVHGAIVGNLTNMVLSTFADFFKEAKSSAVAARVVPPVAPTDTPPAG